MKQHNPDISIIIVSYNSWEFLDLTLFSVSKAIEDISAEVIVVDNASSINIVDRVRQSYPFVITVGNNENLGFSKANNIGLKMAKGKIAVLVNPDIIVGEDTFKVVLNHFDQDPVAGGIGLRMINGEGNYLKESMRGLPTPFASFCKITGLVSLFPKSKQIARYYHGDLDETQNQKVDVLAGAFLAQRRDDNGEFELLDEQYFMYGEDIDLSYCLMNKFGSNHFLGAAPIIHFKGKSTVASKEIYQYFYQSMWIFHRKYFFKKTFFLVNALIWVAINGIQVLKTAMLELPVRTAKNKTFRPSRILLISHDEKLKDKLGETYHPAEIFISEKIDESQMSDMIVFDMGSISLKDIITGIVKNGTGAYAYASPDGKYMIENSLVGGKGQVVYF
ncbi:glycosyltransferase [Carboxylicivirga caseinilyticus]|uniref:glycosyltransferase n=1 Tax=Carboxylicivirga caseinilyticus TaxID=3417572 RepID=UPI003D347B44|nr:glycosyltransferase family 2 protein [Marinilabiliaceae bacterium A049]